MPNDFRFLSKLFAICAWTSFIALAPSPAYTTTQEVIPLVRGSKTSQEEFEAFAKANGRKIYSDFLDVASHEDSRALSSLIERAQEAWVDSSASVARTLFERVADLALENDWSEPEREAIQYSLLRLAQITAPGAEQSLWIEKAVAFDWEHQPESSLFPPPLLEKFRDTRERMMKAARPIRFDKILPEHRVIRINGRRIDVADRTSVLVPKGRFRISAYSDSLPAIVEKLETDRIVALSPKLQPLAFGNCESPEGGDGALGKVSVFDALYDRQCLRRRHAIGWMKESETMAAPSAMPENWPLTSVGSSSHSEMSKRSWLWIGLSALVAGAAYYVYQEQQKPSSSDPAVQTQPIHRQGF